MPPYVLDRARWAAKHSPQHVLHPGSKPEVPVIDAENPLGDPLEFPGLVEGDGRIRVHVPVAHGGPGFFFLQAPST